MSEQNYNNSTSGSESQEYTYNPGQSQVTVPAPERHQTVTYVDSVETSKRYVNNEYMSQGTPVQPVSQPAVQPVQSTVQVVQQTQPVQSTVQAVQQTQPVQSTVQVVQQTQPVQSTVQPVQQTQPVQPAVQPPVQYVRPSVQPVQQTRPVSPTVQPAPSVRPAAQPQAASAPYAAVQSKTIPTPQPAPAPYSAQAEPQKTTPVPPVPPTPPVSDLKADSGKKPPKKKQNAFVKILIAALCGLVFGLVAGGVILLMVRFIPNNLQAINQQGVISSEIPSENPSTVLAEPDSEKSSEISPEADVLVAGENNEITATEVTTDMSVPEVAQECMPAIVIINTLVDYNYYGFVQEVPASGTGVIVGMNEEDLFIATNYHVVEGAKEIKVQFCDSSAANAEMKGKKVSADLAVITVDISSLGSSTKDAIKLAKIGDSDKLVVGESCVAIGNALGYGQSVTTGVISALDREVTTEKGETGRFIQTDAAINPGNSGGALLNMRGELIGINSNKLGGTTVEGMGYAIPINTARPIIQNLIDKKELQELPEEQQSYFGISGATVKGGLTTSNGIVIPEGIYVTKVVPGSPADLAGIQAGDIITEFEGESVVSTAELMQYLASYPSGAEVTITYRRLENNKFITYDTKVKLESKTGTGTGGATPRNP